MPGTVKTTLKTYADATDATDATDAEVLANLATSTLVRRKMKG